MAFAKLGFFQFATGNILFGFLLEILPVLYQVILQKVLYQREFFAYKVTRVWDAAV